MCSTHFNKIYSSTTKLKMASFRITLIFSSLCLIVVMCITQVQSLKCVSCVGAEKGHCMNHIPKAIECPNLDKSCLKRVTRTNGIEIIMRKCSFEASVGCVDTGGVSTITCDYSCNTDKCNGGNSVINNNNMLYAIFLSFGLLLGASSYEASNQL